MSKLGTCETCIYSDEYEHGDKTVLCRLSPVVISQTHFSTVDKNGFCSKGKWVIHTKNKKSIKLFTLDDIRHEQSLWEEDYIVSEGGIRSRYAHDGNSDHSA